MRSTLPEELRLDAPEPRAVIGDSGLLSLPHADKDVSTLLGELCIPGLNQPVRRAWLVQVPWLGAHCAERRRPLYRASGLLSSVTARLCRTSEACALRRCRGRSACRRSTDHRCRPSDDQCGRSGARRTGAARCWYSALL